MLHEEFNNTYVNAFLEKQLKLEICSASLDLNLFSSNAHKELFVNFQGIIWQQKQIKQF